MFVLSLHLSKCHIVGNRLSWLKYSLKQLNEFNRFNNTGAQMLDSEYHTTLNYFEIVYLA